MDLRTPKRVPRRSRRVLQNLQQGCLLGCIVIICTHKMESRGKVRCRTWIVDAGKADEDGCKSAGTQAGILNMTWMHFRWRIVVRLTYCKGSKGMRCASMRAMKIHKVH